METVNVEKRQGEALEAQVSKLQKTDEPDAPTEQQMVRKIKYIVFFMLSCCIESTSASAVRESCERLQQRLPRGLGESGQSGGGLPHHPPASDASEKERGISALYQILQYDAKVTEHELLQKLRELPLSQECMDNFMIDFGTMKFLSPSVAALVRLP